MVAPSPPPALMVSWVLVPKLAKILVPPSPSQALMV